MIVEMMKLRVLGPQPLLEATLRRLQDLGIVHITPSSALVLRAPAWDPQELRRLRWLRRMAEDADNVAEYVQPSAPLSGETALDLPRIARWLRRLRRRLARMSEQRTACEEERALIGRYRPFFAAFKSLLEGERAWVNATPFHVLLRPQQANEVARLRDALSSVFRDEFDLRSHTLPTGEVALLLIVPTARAQQVERILSDAGVQDIPLPSEYAGRTFGDAVPALLARYDAIPKEIARLDQERAALLGEISSEVLRVRALLHDCVTRRDTAQLARTSGYAFIVEGWAPVRARTHITRALQPLGPTIVLEELSREQWAGEDVPVVLTNPAILRPFELLIRLFPLPRYGTIDPTPFVAVFFPMFFGLITGDIGYGLAFAAVGTVLLLRSREPSTVHTIAQILLACAMFTVAFGFLFGEFFGTLGHEWFGLEPIWFDRANALVPFLILAVSLGAVHVLLGLVLGVISARSHPRQAVGRGLTALMVVLIAIAVLASSEVLPRAFFTPVVVTLLAVFRS
jgi:V/A-type H+-transporting ATPase subunit I